MYVCEFINISFYLAVILSVSHNLWKNSWNLRLESKIKVADNDQTNANKKWVIIILDFSSASFSWIIENPAISSTLTSSSCGPPICLKLNVALFLMILTSSFLLKNLFQERWADFISSYRSHFGLAQYILMYNINMDYTAMQS